MRGETKEGGITAREIMQAIVTWKPPIFPRDLHTKLGIPTEQCGRRMQVLHHWGCVKYAEPGKRGWRGYEVTEWGRRYARGKEEV